MALRETRGTALGMELPMLVYTRQDAIEDGVFTNVSGLARQAGIGTRVAITPGIRDLVAEDAKAIERGEKEETLLQFLFRVIKEQSRLKRKLEKIDLSTLVYDSGDLPPKLIYEDLIIGWEENGNGRRAITIMLACER